MILCIDWGATLVKIVKGEEKKAVRYEEFCIDEYIYGVEEIRVTGIRSLSMPESIRGIMVRKFDEFEVIADAAKSGLAVNIGTGTSMVDTKRKKHVGGTGVGGGTIVGLCSLFSDGGFEEYETMARKGNRNNADLLIGDICGGIGSLSAGVTASNLFKLSRGMKTEDCISGIFNMVGEVVGTVACIALRSTDLEHITFLGSAVRSEILKEVLKGVCNLYGCDCRFSKDPQFSVVSALMTKKS
jgi:type II pantothenate kinase